MESRLTLLYALQLVDTQIDEVHELKGDLPRVVASLKEKLDLQTSLRKHLEDTARQSLAARDAADVEILALKERMEKYKTQQFEVKTNKQYDALGREIDAAQERIAKMAKDMDIQEGNAATAKQDAEQLGPELEELGRELAERQKELDEVNKEHEDEEAKLAHEREKLVARVSKSDMKMYEMIRSAKDGKAVVAVKRNSCGGCFNRVPPQMVLELRKNSTVMTCERCGRVLVSDEIVESVAHLAL